MPWNTQVFQTVFVLNKLPFTFSSLYLYNPLPISTCYCCPCIVHWDTIPRWNGLNVVKFIMNADLGVICTISVVVIMVLAFVQMWCGSGPSKHNSRTGQRVGWCNWRRAIVTWCKPSRRTGSCSREAPDLEEDPPWSFNFQIVVYLFILVLYKTKVTVRLPFYPMN